MRSARQWLSAPDPRLTLLACALSVPAVSCSSSHPPDDRNPQGKQDRTVSVNNADPRRDLKGEIIDAHDGCLQFFEGRYYL